MILWSPAEHSDQENLMWCWLRAVEWNAWPVFVSQPLVPLLFLLWPAWKVIVALVAADVLWGLFIRYSVVIPVVAEVGVYFVQVKWVTIPLAVVMLITRGQYWLAALALFWTWAAGAVGAFLPGSDVGRTQRQFMACFGYRYDNPLANPTPNEIGESKRG